MEHKNILIITHWSYRDALVQTYTLPYVKIIRNILSSHKKIILVTSEQKKIALTNNEINEINEEWKGRNTSLIAQPYHAMGTWKILTLLYHIWKLIAIIKSEKISTIHCFCTPAGTIGYILSKITGARLIIDSYEPHAESMVENGTWGRKSIQYRLLSLFEKLQSQKATCFIATTAAMKEYAKKRFSVDANILYVKPACVDLKKFILREKDEYLMNELNLVGKKICVYAGKLGGIYLKSEVFDFIKVCHQFWGDEFRFLLLTNSTRQDVLIEMNRVELPENAVIQMQVNYEDVPRYLSLGDFAINPVKPVPTKKYCTSIKDGEYWATGLPVVITKNISDDSEIIKRSGYGYELQKLSIEEYNRALTVINKLISGNVSELRRNIRKIAEDYRNYQIAINIYTEIYS